MQVNIVSCFFVLDSEKNPNIRKNDVKKLKVLVDSNNELPKIAFEGKDIKKQERKNLSKIIGSNEFHLEQVYTIENGEGVDIIYLGITNIENVEKLDKEYKLVDFNVINKSIILLDGNKYSYKTVEKEEHNNIEYIHEINVKNKDVKKTLMYLLISFKRIRANIDNTDIIFKFMGNVFSLEDVRIIYELIKDCSTDKSNFRKKIIKYCEKVESNVKEKNNGYRPSQNYKFVPLKNDKWI